MKIIVLGAAGMLGHKVFQVLRNSYPKTLGTILGSKRGPDIGRVELLQGDDVLEGVDVTDGPVLQSVLSARRPDVVVNCVGVVKQRREAKLALPSIAINALLPHILAKLCSSWGGRLIHFSTDCVFDGGRGDYTEDDRTDAVDLYGRTKALGEVGQQGEPRALTLRTSIIGRELATFESLLEWFLARNGAVTQGYTQAIYSGVTTNHLANLVSRIIAEHPNLMGLYQVAGERISKHELLCQLRDAYRLDVVIKPDDSVRIDRSMRGDKLRQAISYVAPPWPQLIGELVTDPTPYEWWRS